MKKIEYLAPEEKVVKIELSQIICTSPGGEIAPDPSSGDDD